MSGGLILGWQPDINFSPDLIQSIILYKSFISLEGLALVHSFNPFWKHFDFSIQNDLRN